MHESVIHVCHFRLPWSFCSTDSINVPFYLHRYPSFYSSVTRRSFCQQAPPPSFASKPPPPCAVILTLVGRLVCPAETGGYIKWSYCSWQVWPCCTGSCWGTRQNSAHGWCWHHQCRLTFTWPCCRTFSHSPGWMSYDPMTQKAPVVACIICHTLTHCSVARSPKLVVLVVKSAVRPTYCNSDARYPGMEVTRPAG